MFNKIAHCPLRKGKKKKNREQALTTTSRLINAKIPQSQTVYRIWIWEKKKEKKMKQGHWHKLNSLGRETKFLHNFPGTSFPVDDFPVFWLSAGPENRPRLTNILRGSPFEFRTPWNTTPDAIDRPESGQPMTATHFKAITLKMR